jgi:serine/threonine protein kinase
MASGSPQEHVEHDRCFIILDRLDGTLLDKLEHWKKQARRLNHPVMTGLLDKHGLKRKQFLLERLKVATEIASALEYLHGNRIVYRDLVRFIRHFA